MADIVDRLAKFSPEQRERVKKRLASLTSAKLRAAMGPAGDAEVAHAPDGKPPAEPIAIVGMGCRFAGAPGIEAYWRMISEGIEGVCEVPPDRWPVDDYYDPAGGAGKTITRRGAFLEGIDQFDPTFFGITPREASRMDPQQRLLLEVAWEALENAGCPADKMAGTLTGVYVGIGGHDYAKVPSQSENYYRVIDGHVGTGNALSIASNRISYVLDLQGPSLSVDTACSSSSLAIHLAVQSLRRGECNAALAGGVNAILTPETTIAFSKAHMLSPEGRCRPFDSSANGYVRGEGCGLLVLKRLSDAEAAGDEVLAVIRGTAANQDGRTPGISAPSAERQRACLLSAMGEAGYGPDDIDYVEAHGTSTPLGDPIEMRALAEVFRRTDSEQPPLWVTSVKANIGHTETVSGVAGLIKAVLLMKHGVVPPQLHLNELNPHIHLDGSRVELPMEAQPWPKRAPQAGEDEPLRPRVAGISSFGFGGTNTHLVISEPNGGVSQPDAPPSRKTRVVKLSAKTPDRIAEQARRLSDWLREEPAADLVDIAFTANTGRCDFVHRAAVTASDVRELTESLDQLAAEGAGPGIHSSVVSARPSVAWLFTGQGSQRPGMGRGLYEQEPVFRQVIDQCDEALADVLDESLCDILYGGDKSDSRVHQTHYTQPALFAVECGLAALWRSAGVQPDVLLGHSIGEYAAAVAAGVMSLEEGAQLVARRARLMHAAPGKGAMAVLFAEEAIVAEMIAGQAKKLSIAAVNGPENTVISGERKAVEVVVSKSVSAGIRTHTLEVSHAFHSPLMDPVLDEFEQFAEQFEYRTPDTPIVSNVSGRLMTDGYSASYWRDHVRGAVRFADGVAAATASGARHWIEIGPAPVLLGMARRCDPQGSGSMHWLPSLREGQDDAQTFSSALAEHWVGGGEIDWRGWAQGRGRRLSLPNYPFERERYWYEGIEPTGSRDRIATATGEDSPALGGRLKLVGESRVYETPIATDTPTFLTDHRVQGSVVTPGAWYIEQALAVAGGFTDEERGLRVDGLSIGQAMFLSEGSRRRAQTTVAAESSGRRMVEMHSSSSSDSGGDEWALHGSAEVVVAGAGERPNPIDLASLEEQFIDSKSKSEFYELLTSRGLQYGPAFQMLGAIKRSAHDTIVEVRPTETVLAESARYRLHPVFGDALMQAVACTTPLEADGSYSQHTYLPVGVESVRVWQRVPADEPLFAYAVRRSPAPGADDDASPESVTSDAYLVLQDGTVLASFQGVRVQRLASSSSAQQSADHRDWLYRVDWQRQELQETSEVPSGAWLVLCDRADNAKPIAEHLLSAGGSVVVAEAADCFEMQVGDSSATSNGTAAKFDPSDDAHYERLLGLISTNPAKKPAGVVFLGNPTADDPAGDWEREAGVAMRLLQQAARRSLATETGVWLVTHGAQDIGEGQASVNPQQATVVGMCRVAQMEHPELSVRLIDLEPGANDYAGDLAVAVSQYSNGENQLAVRSGELHAARLVRDESRLESLDRDSDASTSIPRSKAHQLRIPTPGSFDALRYEAFEPVAPGPGQVQLEVQATGLNFSDILKALGLYPGIKDVIVPLGIEASGVVTAVGEGVDRFAVGDSVMGVAPYALGSHTTTAEYALAKKPDAMSHDEAVTIPVTFLTAYHALVRLAHLQPGERVLIHAGAGGVGLAAIQIAQQIGAEVFATAGSDEKRDLLRSLGVRHVMNSRTLDFVEEVRRATDREGVDVVLNSLPGEAIGASLGLLKAYGRFCEIGKIDIYQNHKIGLLPFQDNLSYFAIDLDRVLRERPDYVRALFNEVMQQFERGDYQPLRHTCFAPEETATAFRYMSQRKNIGKVVVTRTSGASEPEASAGPIRSDGSYLITGGLGALGLRCAGWLSEQGAGGVALLSRRAPSTESEQAIQRLRDAGIEVACLQGDVTERASLDNALESLPANFPPVRGVLHAAGVLDDGLLVDLTAERLARVLSPKTVGAWNLHQASLDPDSRLSGADGQGLDLFVLFSSVAALLGSPGQANYAAANTALDAIASLRRSQGLPALSINWGPWSGEGLAQGGMASGSTEDSVRQKGMDLLDPAEAVELMGRLLTSDTPQVAAFDARWDAMSQLLTGRRVPLLEGLCDEEAMSSDGSAADSALRAELLSVTADERQERLLVLVRDELARVMSVRPDQLDTEQPLASLGIDSLMALELKNNLESMLAFTLPMGKLLEGPSVAGLAEAAAEALAGEACDQIAGAWSPLVTLQAGQEGAPALFLMPSLGGDVSCYRELQDRMDPKKPLVAFRPRGIDDDAEPHDQIDELAADYAAAIRAHQPEGPYHLAGWSTGGLVGLAVTERLESEGAEVAMLALFDTPLPAVYDSIDTDDEARFLVAMLDFAARFLDVEMSVSLEQLESLPAEERFGAVLQQAKAAGVVTEDVDEAYVRRLAKAGEALVRASRQYEPRPLKAPIHFFSPDQDHALSGLVPSSGGNADAWQSVHKIPLSVRPTPGDHFSMMSGESVESLAKDLAELF